jgi:hypothetical protein
MELFHLLTKPLSVNPMFELVRLSLATRVAGLEGISVGSGKQHYLDATIAYKRSPQSLYQVFHKFDTRKKAGVPHARASSEGISGIVDVRQTQLPPGNSPAIFDRDVRPPKSMDMPEQLIFTVSRCSPRMSAFYGRWSCPHDPQLTKSICRPLFRF